MKIVVTRDIKVEGSSLLIVASPVTQGHGKVPTRCASVGYTAAGIRVNVCESHGPPGTTWMSRGLRKIGPTITGCNTLES